MALEWPSSWSSSSKGVSSSPDMRPWVRAFCAVRALPSGVRGPVECCALRRLAAICSLVAMKRLLLVRFIAGGVVTETLRSGGKLWRMGGIWVSRECDWSRLQLRPDPYVRTTFFATGEGQTSPAGADGKPDAAPYAAPKLLVSVKIGGQTAEILYAGAAPGEV